MWILGCCLETAWRINLWTTGTKSSKTKTSSHAQGPFPIVGGSFWNNISTGKTRFSSGTISRSFLGSSVI